MREVCKHELFKENKKLSVKVDGFEVEFNIVELSSGGFKAHMLVMKLTNRTAEEVDKWYSDVFKEPYVIKTKVDPRDVEGLKELDLERSAVELVRERLAGYMPCIRKHRKALVEYIKAYEELGHLDIEHDDGLFI